MARHRFITVYYDGGKLDLCVPEVGALGQAVPLDHPLWNDYATELAKLKDFTNISEIWLGRSKQSTATQPTTGALFDMSAPIMQNITQYRGRNIKDLSPEQILEAIRADKKEIQGLEGVGVESAHIAARIAKLNEGIAALVVELDSRG